MRRLAALLAAATLLVGTGCPRDDDPEPEPTTTTTTTTTERSRTVRVPNVVGFFEDDARLAVELYDLVVRTKPADPGCNVDPGDVCEQAPAAGTRVKRGTTVTLTLEPEP